MPAFLLALPYRAFKVFRQGIFPFLPFIRQRYRVRYVKAARFFILLCILSGYCREAVGYLCKRRAHVLRLCGCRSESVGVIFPGSAQVEYDEVSEKLRHVCAYEDENNIQSAIFIVPRPCSYRADGYYEIIYENRHHGCNRDEHHVIMLDMPHFMSKHSFYLILVKHFYQACVKRDVRMVLSVAEGERVRSPIVDDIQVWPLPEICFLCQFICHVMQPLVLLGQRLHVCESAYDVRGKKILQKRDS